MLNYRSQVASVESTTPEAIAEPRRPALSSYVSKAARFLSGLLSDDTLTRKAYLNALAEAIDYAARLVVGFLVNPILVAGLGDYGYGAWQVLGRLIGYISPASGRPGQALKFTVAYLKSSPNAEEKRRQVGSCIIVWLYFVPLLALLGGVLTWFAPVWLHAPTDLTRQVRIATALLAINLIVVNLAELPRSALQGENLEYKRIGLSTMLVIAGGALIVLALHFRMGLGGVAAANLATTLLTGALFLRIVCDHVQWFGVSRPSLQEIRHFLGLSWWFLGWRSVLQLMIASDVVVLGLVGSVEGVTGYTLTKYAPETLISWIAIVVWGVTPGLGGIIGEGDFKKASALRGELTSVTWLIATALGATTLLWNRSFIYLWVGGKYDVGLLNTLLILIMAIQLALIRSDANIIDATLKLRSKVVVGGISAVISVVLGATLVWAFKLGVTGLCLGFLIGRLILTLSYPLQIGRAWGISLLSQLKCALRPAITMAALFGVVLIPARTLLVRTWPGLVFSVAFTTLITAPLAFFTGLPRDTRERLLRRMISVLRPSSS
jgi:O-antigen/teichoic acid export membrane protein